MTKEYRQILDMGDELSVPASGGATCNVNCRGMVVSNVYASMTWGGEAQPILGYLYVVDADGVETLIASKTIQGESVSGIIFNGPLPENSPTPVSIMAKEVQGWGRMGGGSGSLVVKMRSIAWTDDVSH